MSSGNIHKLSALKIKKIRKAGRYSDGNCLYLVIKDTGARQWVLRLVIRGKRHDMGLGSSTLVSLEEARDLARQYRRIAREGGDPLIARQRDLGLLITVRDAAKQGFVQFRPHHFRNSHCETAIKISNPDRMWDPNSGSENL